jgi:hypothetical protein
MIEVNTAALSNMRRTGHYLFRSQGVLDRAIKNSAPTPALNLDAPLGRVEAEIFVDCFA